MTAAQNEGFLPSDCKGTGDHQGHYQVPEGNIASVSAPEARKVRCKIDFVLLPLLGFCYMLQFLDKQTLSYAYLLGILEDTHLVNSQFSWTVSIFYFGFIFWSYPTVCLFVRLPIGKYLCCTVSVLSAAASPASWSLGSS